VAAGRARGGLGAAHGRHWRARRGAGDGGEQGTASEGGGAGQGAGRPAHAGNARARGGGGGPRTLHERLRRETPFAAHHARKVKPTDSAHLIRAMPLLSAARPHLEDTDGLDDDHSWVFEQPTYHSFKDLKRHSIGWRLTELPFACRHSHTGLSFSFRIHVQYARLTTLIPSPLAPAPARPTSCMIASTRTPRIHTSAAALCRSCVLKYMQMQAHGLLA
jgi:hypothetical protein